MGFKQHVRYIGGVLRHPGYVLIALGVAALYLLVNLLVVLHVHESLGGFYKNMYATYTVPFTILVIISGLLVGVDIALLVAKLKELRFKTAGLGVTGILFGSLAAGCPGCFFGLFPVVLSLFGISATLAILPFNGLELQVAAVMLLLWSIYVLASESVVVCELPARPPHSRGPRRETI